MAVLHAPAATPHMALNTEERQMMGRNRSGYAGASISRSRATSLIRSAKSLHRLMSIPKLELANAVNSKPPSIELPSLAIHCIVAAREVTPALPTPIPSRICAQDTC